MQSPSRSDLLLAVGLTAVAAIAFARPLASAVSALGDLERTSGVAVLPGLALASILIAWYYLLGRLKAQRRAIDAAAAAARAQDRSRELERLLDFWRALFEALDLEAIREVLPRHLDEIAGRGGTWVLVREGGRWESMLGGRDAGRGAASHEAVATETMAALKDSPARDGHAVGGHLVFPMVTVGTIVGVIGVPDEDGRMTVERRHMVGAAAALLAVSVRNAQLIREIRDTSLRDPLTRCVNRAHAFDVLAGELRRARRTGQPLSIIMFDLDHFKEVNDRHGHLAGDAVLAWLGARIHSELRGSDVKCRYGGEEFLVVLPDTPIDGALRVADSLRRTLAENPLRWNGDDIRVTASFGVVAARPGETDVHALVTRADAALYRAKRDGRNRVSEPVTELAG